jgi:carbamoyltransferase
MNVIGISAYFHDAACCLLHDGQLLAAAEEKRFTRSKHYPQV